jgi:hypothetical protein
MKWFFNWLYKGLKQVDMDDRSSDRATESILMPKINIGLKTYKNRNAIAGATASASSDGSIHLNQSPMNFRIYPATGGHIVEYTYYNERKDSQDQALHLIPSELDLGTELAKIMTLEALKR